MRCNEARKLLTSGAGDSDPDLAAHLKTCAGCRVIVLARNELEALLKVARTDVPVSDLETVRKRVERAARSQSRWEIIMSRLENTTKSHRRLAAGMAFALAAFLFVTLVPFSYTTVAGFRVTLIDQTGPRFSAELLADALSAVGFEDVTVLRAEADNQYILSGLTNRQEAEDIAAALASLSGSQEKPAVEPVLRESSGSIYAQAVKKLAPEDKGPVRVRLVDGRFVLNGVALEEALRRAGTSPADVSNALKDYFNDQGVFEGDLIISAVLDRGQEDQIIRVQDSSGDTYDEDGQPRCFRGDVALKYRPGDSALDDEGRFEVISGEELDSMKAKAGSGIVLEFPDGTEVGEDVVLLQVRVMPKNQD